MRCSNRRWPENEGEFVVVRAIVDTGVLEVTIRDGSRGNIVDLAWVADAQAALALVGPEVGCVLIRSEGKNFGLGGDISVFAGEDPAAGLRRLVDGVHALYRDLAALQVPIVIAVQGWAAGVSMSLVLLADIVLIGASARLKTAYAGIGLTSDGGITWTLPRRVPHAVALDLLLTDRSLSADEAVAFGIASRIIADDCLASEARELSMKLAAGPRAAHRAIKSLVLDGRDASLYEQLDAEAEAMVQAVVSPEGIEGVRAFMERRPPDFIGARSAAGS